MESNEVMPDVETPAHAAKPRRFRSGTDQRRRTAVIAFRCTPEEKHTIQSFADRANVGEAAYCRAVLLRRKIPTAPMSKTSRADLSGAVAQLGKVGSNVNQIARALNGGDAVLDDDIAATMEAIRETVTALLKALGRSA